MNETSNVVLWATRIVLGLLVLLLGLTAYRSVSDTLAAGRFYGEAQEAIEEGDLERAKESLVEVVRRDAAYKDATSLLAEVKQQISASEDATTTTFGARNSSAGAGRESSASARRSAPPAGGTVGASAGSSERVSGYTLVSGAAELRPGRQQVYKPQDPESNVASVTARMRRHESAGAASEAVYSLRHQYPFHQQNIMINGSMAYYGTSKERAVLAWSRGDETVELEAGPKSGAPLGLLGPLIDIARGL